ncbi:MAG: hypothetical protein IIU65_06025 [Clostridia bacterium]|nr:hypothetical protein [Clostridia bacterium]
MKNTKKIIIATSVVLVLAVAFGVILFNPFKPKAKIVSAKQPVQITLPKADTSLKDFYNERNEGAYKFASQAWDMIEYKGRVFLSAGDYNNNSGSAPVYYYDPKTQKFEYCDSVYTEQVSEFEIINDKLITTAVDPVSWGVGEYYVYNEQKDVFDYYSTLPSNIHCYDVEYFDGKYFFSGSTDDAENYAGVQWIKKEDFCSDDLDKTHQSFLMVDGERNPLDFRVYQLFAYKGELFAWHYEAIPERFHEQLGIPKYLGLFKYNKEKNCFEKLSNEYNLDPIIEKVDHKIDLAKIQAKLIYDDKYVFANNGLLFTEDFKNYTECSFGKGYDGFVTRDIFEREGQLYVLASKELKNGKFKTSVFVTENLKKFAEVLNFEADSYMISFEHVEDTFIFCEGGKYENTAESCGNLYACKVD